MMMHGGGGGGCGGGGVSMHTKRDPNSSDTF